MKTIETLKLLIPLTFICFSFWSCARNEDVLFTIRTETTFDLPAQNPLTTLVLPLRIDFPLKSRLESEGLSREDVRIQPQHVRLNILNSGTWLYAQRAALDVRSGSSDLRIFESDDFSSPRGSEWILLPFDLDMNPYMEDTYYDVHLKITSLSSSPRLNRVSMDVRFDVFRK